MKKRWVIAAVENRIPVDVESRLSEYSPLMRQILYNRDIDNEKMANDFLRADDSYFHDPFLMKNMEKAANRILQAVDGGEKIAIYGDYDVDGVTASALLVQVLRSMEASAEHYIPDRHTEGYGLNCEALTKLKSDGYALVVSVDCGIRSEKEAIHASEIGLDLIITDHHEPGDNIPEAYTVLNPRQPGDNYPYKDLAGVGIAFKLADALLRLRPGFTFQANAWLDLVAVGTVADVAPLTGENRVMVKFGLNMLSRRDRQGLRSLMGAAGIEEGKRINTYHIGFMIGPRLNAAGRMETAETAYQILMTADVQEAGRMAQELDNQNKERQKITRKIQELAENMVSGDDFLVFSVSEDFTLGVVGLAASRLAEKFYRPAVVGIIEGETTRASCRSIPEFHITEALDEVEDLLVKHGGHAAAAGFTVMTENLPHLERELKRIAFERLADKELIPTLIADVELSLSDVTPAILQLQSQIEPTGNGNREVRFVSRNLKVTQHKKIGKDQSHLRLTLTDGRITYDAVAFKQADWADSMPGKIDILFSLEENVWMGKRSLQLNILDIQPSEVNQQSGT